MTTSLPILYAKPGCPWCIEVDEFLKANDIAVTARNVVADPAARAEMQKISGQSKVPTLDWNGKILADFGVAELKPFLADLKVPMPRG